MPSGRMMTVPSFSHEDGRMVSLSTCICERGRMVPLNTRVFEHGNERSCSIKGEFLLLHGLKWRSSYLLNYSTVHHF